MTGVDHHRDAAPGESVEQCGDLVVGDHAHDGFAITYNHVDRNESLVEAIGLVAVGIGLLEAMTTEIEENLIARRVSAISHSSNSRRMLARVASPSTSSFTSPSSNPRSAVMNPCIARASLTGPINGETLL